MQQVIEGEGLLKDLSQSASVRRVRYQFTINTPIIRRPGFPTASGKGDSSGYIESLDGELVSDGIYELATPKHGVFRVEKLGSDWTILAMA